MGFFQKLFAKARDRGKEGKPTRSGDDFAARFHRFKLFMTAHMEAYSELMGLEERLGGPAPVSMPYLRTCTARLTVAAMQCVMQLNALTNGAYSRLDQPFTSLREAMSGLFVQGMLPAKGPLLLPFGRAGEEHKSLVAPELRRLERLEAEFPGALPPGFMLTAAAWWLFTNDADLHDEIDRLIQISQDDPESFGEAGAIIRERILNFPLPLEVSLAVDKAMAELAEQLERGAAWDRPGLTVRIRGHAVLPEHAALVLPEQNLYTPVTPQDIKTAVVGAFSTAYRARSIVYRMKLGIRDRAMPLCVSVSFLPRDFALGSAHNSFADPDGLPALHVRRGFEESLAERQKDACDLPEQWAARLAEAGGRCLNALRRAYPLEERHEVHWAVARDGRFFALAAVALPCPAEVKAVDGEQRAEPLVAGGIVTYPGRAEGLAYLVRNMRDALNFPLGGVLVLPQAAPRWSFLLHFASGAVAGDGTGHGPFAAAARCLGRPALLGQPKAPEALSRAGRVRLEAPQGAIPLVLDLEDVADDPPAPLWIQGSHLHEMVRALGRLALPLALPDADHPDFRAANCKSFMDLITYCHDHAVQAMYEYSTTRKSAQSPAKQLVSEVPKQFWVINLDDGFKTKIPGPSVDIGQIACLPLRAFWDGFVDKPWEGPPQVDARGFMAVLFEASVNPGLDPAAQNTRYAERNTFMISRHFCGMRCRFGFHFLSMDSLAGKRDKENFIIFQFKGGAADQGRRIRRVRFVAGLLDGFGFSTDISGDALTARLERGPSAQFERALRVVGYLSMHTRQLDMIMGDESALAARRKAMLVDMRELYGR